MPEATSDYIIPATQPQRLRDWATRPAWINAGNRDPQLLTACAAFHRLNAALMTVAPDDERALEHAWDARRRVADHVASLRPTSDAGRRAKAAVGFSILSETPNWERGSEWEFAMAAFRSEGWA